MNIASIAISGDNIFAGTEGSGVYLSTDMGLNWNAVGLKNFRVYSIAIKGDRIFAGTYHHGVWSSSLVELITSIGESKEDIPADLTLEQNYPNPFNGTTIINFSIPEQSKVALKIFDILGGEVETLLNKQIEGGVHSVEFDGSSLPSGIYFYRLQSSDFTQTKKLLLLK